jgi:hypothetical protein
VENADALLERYGQTGILAEKLLPLGKWIQVSGRFEGAADSLIGDAMFASLILENGRRIQLRFPLRLRLIHYATCAGRAANHGCVSDTARIWPAFTFWIIAN